MLFKQLDRLKRDAIMAGIILMLIGMMFLIIPEDYMQYIGTSIGFILLVISAESVFDFIGSGKALIHYIKLTAGLFIGLFGILLFAFDGMFIDILSWLAGTVPVVLGIIGVIHALIFARRSKRKGWWILIILSSFLLAFGTFVFINPFMENTAAAIRVIGGTLLYSAFVSLLSLIWIWPVHREL